MVNSKYLITFILFLLLVFAAIVRLYRFNNPVADWHSWRQADTSAVSRNFVKHGFDILHPKFDDLSNVPSGIDNLQGYRFVEFPIYNIAQAGLYEAFPILNLEEWGRLVTIIASLISTLFIFLIVRKHVNTTAGLFAAFFYAFLPYNIYYGRTILPDTSMVTASLGGVYFFDKWLEKTVSGKAKVAIVCFILSLLFTSMAFLLKPYAMFFTLPQVYLATIYFRLSLFKQWKLYVFLILSVVPLIWWRWWMTRYPPGIPVSDWLFNGGNIRFKPAYFFWIFGDRLSRLILGYWGISMLIIGVAVTSRKEFWEQHKKSFGLFLSFLASSLIYVIVIARGNVQHDYYQILIIPTICIYLGIGAMYLLSSPLRFSHPWFSKLLLLIVISFTLFLGWYVVRDYFNINNPNIVVAGRAVDELTPKDAKVIAPYDGDTSFLYQTNRQGWAEFEKPIQDMVTLGADYVVLVNPSSADLNLAHHYRIIAQTPQYVLFDLHQQL